MAGEAENEKSSGGDEGDVAKMQMKGGREETVESYAIIDISKICYKDMPSQTSTTYKHWKGGIRHVRKPSL